MTVRARLLIGVLVSAGVAALAWWLWRAAPEPEGAGSDAAEFAGSAVCARCHAEQAASWRESHHARAMQVATRETVLGDFGGAAFRYGAVESSFAERGGEFTARTDGPDGALHDYAVQYTFGIEPLQQYLIALDRGRLQALSIAWDARAREQGGQRWYPLYADEKVDHRDVLHWTRRSQNWNHMCAECHTTGFAKRYDAATRRYDSRFAEIGVACEACHGPGARHAAWAERRSDPIAGFGLAVSFVERSGISWQRDPGTGLPKRSAARATSIEIDTCARCHSRRSQLAEQPARGQPLAETYLPALLEADLYEADGQIRAEVYEYGSFVQSRMYHEGVTCSDCHEPHSARLRSEGDGVCTQCHEASRYQARSHHFHGERSEAARCVACHMPSRTYMGVDERRDHGFRVPRPAQSVALGTPNACTDCHADRSASWAAATVRAWYGRDPTGFQRYAEVLHAARTHAVTAEPLLIELLGDTAQPAIARATAAAELGQAPSREALGALAPALEDASPLVREAAVSGLAALPPPLRWQLGAPRLRDPVRAVRIAAVSVLAAPEIPPAQRDAWEAASADYLAAQRQNADQPESHMNLGNYLAARGDAAAAERAYRDALALDPDWVPAYANLADLLRVLGRDAEGEALLRDGLKRAPEAAALHHSLGLLRVRAGDLAGAIGPLRRASELAPGEPRYAYVYSVALKESGRVAEAVRVADAALARAPGDRALREWRDQLASP